jgi:hypothetical protein
VFIKYNSFEECSVANQIYHNLIVTVYPIVQHRIVLVFTTYTCPFLFFVDLKVI